MKHIKILLSALVILSAVGIYQPLQAQDGITIHQYRQVAPADMQEFIERETKYWSKVAEHAATKGNLTFWALLVKQGGFDAPNSPNVLFINTYKDIDNIAGTWNPSEVFPDVPIEKMETMSMSKLMHTVYLKSANWVEKEGAVPENDFNYVSMVYHDTDTPGQLIALENEHWAPFIKASMDAGKTPQKAWGNSVILSPSGPDMKATTISYDLYSSLKDALDPNWADDAEFPQEGLAKINEMENGRRINYVYRIVHVVNPNPSN